MNRPIERIMAGAIAGCVATLPMTIAMELLHRRLPATQRQPLPPRKITMKALGPTGATDDLAEPQRLALTLVSHFAYGSAMGSLYGLVKDTVPIQAPTRGVVFGLGVWAGSYFGLLPATGLFPSPNRQPTERNALMIAAHLVWGASLDLVLREIKSAKVEKKALRPAAAPSLRQRTDGEPEEHGDEERQRVVEPPITR